MMLVASSLTFGFNAQADDDKVKVGVKASVEQEARVGVDGGSLYPAVVDVSSFLSTDVSASTTVSARMQKIVQNDTKLINDRLFALAALKTEINANTNLSDSQKSSLKAMIETNISGLNNLLAKIQSDTDEATLKADSDKIYTDFRIYAVFIPKVKLLVNVYTQANHSAQVSDLLVRVQAKINSFSAAGADMSKNQIALDAAKSTLTQVDTKASTFTDKASSLKPSDYPTTSATVIAQVKAGIREIRNFFVQVNTSLRAAIRL